MKVALILVLLSSCGGPAFVQATLTTDDAGAGAGELVPEATTEPADRPAEPQESATPEASPMRDVLSDPWPDGVEVCAWGGTPATGCPCINCFLFDRPDGTTDHYICCDGSGVPSDAATDHLCGQGDYPTPHKAYCPNCGC